MSYRAHQETQRWHVWAVQIALLCLIAFHSVGLLHKHATAAEHGTCVACQVVDHQALGVPEPSPGAPIALWMLLFLVASGHRDVLRIARSLRLPPSRAPPFFLAA